MPGPVTWPTPPHPTLPHPPYPYCWSLAHHSAGPSNVAPHAFKNTRTLKRQKRRSSGKKNLSSPRLIINPATHKKEQQQQLYQEALNHHHHHHYYYRGFTTWFSHIYTTGVPRPPHFSPTLKAAAATTIIIISIEAGFPHTSHSCGSSSSIEGGTSMVPPHLPPRLETVMEATASAMLVVILVISNSCHDQLDAPFSIENPGRSA